MGTKGRKVADAVRRFVIDKNRTSPELSQREIADMVPGTFGETVWIDKSTVGNILRTANHTDPESPTIESEQQSAVIEGRERMRNAHLEELVSLAERLRVQLTIPEPWSRIAEPSMSKAEFLEGISGDAPGQNWYWGWEAKRPMLPVELDDDFPLLRQHTETDPVWSALDELRDQFGAYLGLRGQVLEDIAADCRERLDEVVDDRGEILDFTITSGFARSVYLGAVAARPPGWIGIAERRYKIKGSSIAGPGRVTLSWYPREGSALFFDNQRIAWWPRHTGFSRADIHRNHKESHSALIKEWREHDSVTQIGSKYGELLTESRNLRWQIMSLRSLPALEETSCSACPAIAHAH